MSTRRRLAVLAPALNLLLCAAAAQPPPAQWLDPNRDAPAGTLYRTFESSHAGGPVSYLLYLPPQYEAEPARRFPVIYWLHGLNGTQRSGAHVVEILDRAIREQQAPPAIVALVNGMTDSMYYDAADGNKSVESVIVHGLIPHVDATCRTVARREARAVEGYSMGGFGAAHLGFKYPDLFGAVSIMAGALHTEETLAERRARIFQSIFGGDPNRFRAGSPWLLIEENAAKIRGRTHIRIGVGSEDRLLEWNHQYSEKLTELDIGHEFFTVDGVGHNGREYYGRLGSRAWEFYRKGFAGHE